MFDSTDLTTKIAKEDFYRIRYYTEKSSLSLFRASKVSFYSPSNWTSSQPPTDSLSQRCSSLSPLSSVKELWHKEDAQIWVPPCHIVLQIQSMQYRRHSL